MHRLAAFLLLWALLLAGALLAAPAPFPRPTRPKTPWLDGWDRPVDLLGNCRFLRDGDRLSITVPADAEVYHAARLLRDVEGDFVLRVRVAGNFKEAAGTTGACSAGLMVTEGKEPPTILF